MNAAVKTWSCSIGTVPKKGTIVLSLELPPIVDLCFRETCEKRADNLVTPCKKTNLEAGTPKVQDNY